MILNKLKKSAALAAINYISMGAIIGIGTGSTIFYLIEALGAKKHLVQGAVSSSKESSRLLKKFGIPEFDLNHLSSLVLYIDGADEVNNQLQMIKGGGAALTKEKIIASAAKKFVCIIDESKQVNVLGQKPLPIEIIPMAYSYITRELIKLGGESTLRKKTQTDNGNVIIDVRYLDLSNPIVMENKINNIPGVITVGLFAFRKADVVLVGTRNGIKTICDSE